MDVQIALLSAGVCLISAVVVYLISVYGFREKTYDEAIEDQRKRKQEAFQSSKIDKPKKEKKLKRVNKRSKESRNGEEDIDQAVINHNNDRVEFKPDAEIIPADIDPDSKPSKSKKKLKNPKSILLNKKDVGPVAEVLTSSIDDDDDEEEEENSIHDSSNVFVTVDELERRESLDIGKKKLATLLQNSQSFSESEPLETKSAVVDVNSYQSNVKVVPEIIHETSTDEIVQSSREHFDTIGKENDTSFRKLLSTIKKQSLLEEEIQSLVEILLSKQQDEGDWQKKNNAVANLQKQLAEKEAALEGEQHTTQTAGVKFRELQHELAEEKLRSNAVKQNLHQELATTHAHIQAAFKQQAVIEESHSKAVEEQVLNMQRLSVENTTLQQQLQLLEVERCKWVAHERELQREIEERYQASLVTEQERMNLQLQAKELQLQQLIAAQQEGDFQCSQAVEELKQQLQEARCQNETFGQEVNAELSSIFQKCEEKEMILQKQDEDFQTFKRIAEEEQLKLQGHVDLLQEQLKEAISQLQDNGCQLDLLRSEAESLQLELLSAHKQKESIEALGNSLTAQMQEELILLRTRLVDLEVMVEQYRKDLANAQNELETQKSKNNELREQNWEAMDALSAFEKNSKEREKSQANAMALIQREKEEALTKLEQQHQLFQEQLQLKDEGGISAEQLQRLQKEDRVLLQRIIPEEHVDISLEHSVWLEHFVEYVHKQLAVGSTLRDEKNSLAAQVEHYQTVLADTEKMLKQLQKKVEDHESKWAEELKRKDEETQKALQEKTELEQKVLLHGATKETQNRLSALQEMLETEQNDRQQTECKVKEAQEECAALTVEIEKKNSEIERLQKEMQTVQRLNSYMDTLHKELETERKKSKDLGSQVVKLNSLVKIGEDALREEQTLVKQLQTQISPCSNGNNNTSNHNHNSHNSTCSNNKIPADNGAALENKLTAGNGTVVENKITAGNGTAVENKPTGKSVRNDKPNKSKKRGGKMITGCFR